MRKNNQSKIMTALLSALLSASTAKTSDLAETDNANTTNETNKLITHQLPVPENTPDQIERIETNKAPPPSLTIFFNKDSAELTPSAKEQIAEIADYLAQTGDIVEIMGCTDQYGDEQENFALSNLRWRAVATELHVIQGIASNQFGDLHGQGGDCPSLKEGQQDTAEEARRVQLFLNPEHGYTPNALEHI